MSIEVLSTSSRTSSRSILRKSLRTLQKCTSNAAVTFWQAHGLLKAVHIQKEHTSSKHGNELLVYITTEINIYTAFSICISSKGPFLIKESFATNSPLCRPSGEKQYWNYIHITHTQPVTDTYNRIGWQLAPLLFNINYKGIIRTSTAKVIHFIPCNCILSTTPTLSV